MLLVLLVLDVRLLTSWYPCNSYGVSSLLDWQPHMPHGGPDTQLQGACHASQCDAQPAAAVWHNERSGVTATHISSSIQSSGFTSSGSGMISGG
jgi:hypothetical protein